MQRKEAGDVFGNIAYVFMRDLNMSFEDIKKLPIPMAFELLKRVRKEQKEMEKANKKMKK